jgi:dipeptidyl aminopeptidase/acylaminoacyl peptidase
MARARVLSFAFLFVATAASAATAVLKGPPPRAITDPVSVASTVNPDAAPVPVAELFNVRSLSNAAWTPDGTSIVLSTNLTGRFNLWKVAASGGLPVRLTQSDDRQLGVAVSPDGKWVVFESDFGGGEIYDLFLVPLAGGAVVNLTHSSDASENNAHFSPDGTHLAFDKRMAAAPMVDIAWMDLVTRQVTMLTHEAAPGYFWSIAGFADGGRTLIANRSDIAGKESVVWRIDIATGKAEALTDTKPLAYNAASDVSAGGKIVALTTEQPDGAMQAALFDVGARTTKIVEPDAWEQQSGSLSSDGRMMIFSSNVDGRGDLFRCADGRVTRLDLPPGTNDEADGALSLSPDGRRLLVVHQASNTPQDIWAVDLDTNRATQITTLGLVSVSPRNLSAARVVHSWGGGANRVTQTTTPASVSPKNLPAAQVVHYKSEDGTVISALMWMPFNLKRDGTAPAIVYAHGGPTGQTTDFFSRLILALASRGYVVIAPNPRGSTGYGRAFMEANRKDLGGGDLVDEVYGAKFAAATGFVDPRKIGITGGSYGGYMTLMAIGKTPQLWAAAVEQYGIIDWFSMYEHEAPPLRQYEIGLLGDPVKDKAVYEAASPLTYIKNAKAPLLVLQGENDIRVPKEQAEKVVSMLKAQGTVVDAHFYAAEGHGFVKRENQIDAIERMVAWFDKYLKGAR